MHDDDATIFMGVPDRTEVMEAPAFAAPEPPRRFGFPWKLVLGIELAAITIGAGALAFASMRPSDPKVVAGYPPVTSFTTVPGATLSTTPPASYVEPVVPSTRRARRPTTSQRRSTTTSTS